MPYLVQMKASTFPPGIMRDGRDGPMRKISHQYARVFDVRPPGVDAEPNAMLLEIDAELAAKLRCIEEEGLPRARLLQVTQYHLQEASLLPAAPPPAPAVSLARPAPPLVTSSKPAGKWAKGKV